MEVIGLSSRKRDMHKYYIVANYMADDSVNDKTFIPDDNDGRHMIYRVEVWADSLINAVNRGMEIVTHARAETMADYINSNPMYLEKDTYTRQDIEDIYEQAVEIGLFQNWLAMQPTSIQANRVDDEDKLIDMTVDNVMHHATHIGDDAEDFLKEQDNDA
jgi:transcription initiation factor TFIID subunit TAF12